MCSLENFNDIITSEVGLSMRNLLKQVRKHQKDIPCELVLSHYSLRVGLLPHSKLLQINLGKAGRNIKSLNTSNIPKKFYELVLYAFYCVPYVHYLSTNCSICIYVFCICITVYGYVGV